MVSQHAPWLYSIIHSGRLGVDRNKGHEIVMKQCGGAGDDDDREAAGKNSFSPLFSKIRVWLALPLLPSKICFPSPPRSFCMM